MAGRGPNDRLQHLIAQAGVSYAALARTVCQVAAENGERGFRCDKSSVAHWVAGTRPQPRTAGGPLARATASPWRAGLGAAGALLVLVGLRRRRG